MTTKFRIATSLPLTVVLGLGVTAGCSKSAPQTAAPGHELATAADYGGGGDVAAASTTSIDDNGDDDSAYGNGLGAEAVGANATPAPAPVMEMDMDEAEAKPQAVVGDRERIARGRGLKKSKARAKRERRRDRGPAAIARGAIAPHPLPPSPPTGFTTEKYAHVAEAEFTAVGDDPLSTFSIDVDTASYSNMRRFLRDGSLPPVDAVRIEELVNYFSYDYPQPRGDSPFAVLTEVSDCPWNTDAKLVHVGIQGKEIAQHRVPPRNLVFLLDVSGSMSSPDKLPLLKQSLSMLLPSLRSQDRISIVVYAGASGVVLEPTNDPHQIKAALDRLQSGGSTNGAGGIELAYRVARRAFVRNGINRVILATDGDFNVGVSSPAALQRLIERKRESGIFLSVLGFGRGNLQDHTIETLADHGNGNYAYIDSINEARKVLVEQAGATLVTIAKDVKIQVEFNPTEVAAYRLVGYENRKLAHQDFNDDKKDAGEIGAGHTVTALYEIIPAGAGQNHGPKVDPLKYQRGTVASLNAHGGELMTVKLRYKKPSGARSKLMAVPILNEDTALQHASPDFRFSAAVVSFGMLLRGSKHVGDMGYGRVFELASHALGRDPNGHRTEFLGLIERAAQLSGHELRTHRLRDRRRTYMAGG